MHFVTNFEKYLSSYKNKILNFRYILNFSKLIITKLINWKYKWKQLKEEPALIQVIVIKCHFYWAINFIPLSRNCLSGRVPALEQTFETFSLPSSSIFNYLFNKILLKQSNIPYSIWLVNYRFFWNFS